MNIEVPPGPDHRRITGTVRDGDGRPVARARVFLLAGRDPIQFERDRFVVETGPQGEFVALLHPPRVAEGASWRLVAGAPGWLARTLQIGRKDHYEVSLLPDDGSACVEISLPADLTGEAEGTALVAIEERLPTKDGAGTPQRVLPTGAVRVATSDWYRLDAYVEGVQRISLPLSENRLISDPPVWLGSLPLSATLRIRVRHGARVVVRGQALKRALMRTVDVPGGASVIACSLAVTDRQLQLNATLDWRASGAESLATARQSAENDVVLYVRGWPWLARRLSGADTTAAFGPFGDQIPEVVAVIPGKGTRVILPSEFKQQEASFDLAGCRVLLRCSDR